MTEIYTCARQGKRSTMEDRLIVCADLLNDGGSIAMYAVFDGHGGDLAVSKLEMYFKDVLKIRIENQKQTAKELSQELQQNEDRISCILVDYKQALRDAFRLCDEMVLQEFEKNRQECPFDRQDSGSTAAVVLVVNDTDIYCANAGDTEVVLLKSTGSLCVLSTLHKPNAIAETKRIESAGGQVYTSRGISRVNGCLAVSRAFGNFTLTTYDGKRIVNSEPDVKKETVTEGDILVIACDGLWDVCNYEQVRDDVLTFFASTEKRKTENPVNVGEEDVNAKNCDTCAQMLVKKAIDEKNSSDNVTAIVVKFGKEKTK